MITLIPKKPDALEIKDYRPISRVHSFAKLFSKIIANRFRPRLGEIVSMNQSAFVKRRSLHDNFVLVRQVARNINMRRQTGVRFSSLTLHELLTLSPGVPFLRCRGEWVLERDT
jgi:hypothetical protein